MQGRKTRQIVSLLVEMSVFCPQSRDPERGYDHPMAPQNERLETSAPLENNTIQPRAWRIWRTGLLFATSAVLGGIAVALWNRRSLERIRQEWESRATRLPDEDYAE